MVVVEDFPLRAAFWKPLREEFSLTLLGASDDFFNWDALTDTVSATLAENPDVVVLGINFPGNICFEVGRLIRKSVPEIALVFVSRFVTERYVQEAVNTGARGFLTKSTSAKRFATALRTVAAGGCFFCDEVSSMVSLPSDAVAPAFRSGLSRLSPRQLEILQMIATGLKRKEIAREFDVSVKTVDKHLEHVMTRLEIHDQVGLARFAIREGLVEP